MNYLNLYAGASIKCRIPVVILDVGDVWNWAVWKATRMLFAAFLWWRRHRWELFVTQRGEWVLEFVNLAVKGSEYWRISNRCVLIRRSQFYWLWHRHTGMRKIAISNKRDISQNFTKLLRRKDNIESSNIAVECSWISRFLFSSRKLGNILFRWLFSFSSQR